MIDRILLALLAVLAPVAAMAEKVEEHATHHGIPWAKLVFSSINFAIFIYLLRFLFWGAAKAWVAERRQLVADALAKAERARQEAEALRQEMERRMEHLAAELEQMLAQARADIAVERDQILAAAKLAAEAIHRDAKRTAENEIRVARETLRAEVAHQALALAERLAPQRLTADDQARFVSEFVQQVES
jgi:F-type H+-transporting ATPase subunit b